MRKLSHIASVVAVLVCIAANMANAQAGTLGFYLNGVAYPNGSTVLRTNIGERDNALQCTTDNTTCCSVYNDGEIRAGNFYFPVSDAVVPNLATAVNGYYRDRLSQLIRLHRQANGTITGWFRCNIPQASQPPDADLYINIVDTSVSLTPSGTAIAGQSYSLICSVTVTGSNDTPTITWLDPIDNQITTGVETTGKMSTLTFNPLAASHTGQYTCEVRLGGAVEYEKIIVTLRVFYGVLIAASALSIPTAGETYSLNCSVNGTTDPPTFLWFKGPADDRILLINDKSRTVVSNVSTSRLQFSPLRASDAGLYTCQATVGGVVVKGTKIVTMNFPAPITVTVTPSVVPVFAGSSPNLTCTVKLSSAVDIPVTVNTVWTGPAGFIRNDTAQSVMGSNTTYTSTVIISSIGRYQSANYTCRVTVGIASSFFRETIGYSSSRITVVPKPIVILQSDVPNPALSGSSLTLTCTAELSSVVNISYSVSTMWKGPQGIIIASSAATEMKSYTLYTLSNNLRFLRLADSGEYTCTMNFGNGVEVSASTNITIVDAMFQLRLKSVDICQHRYYKHSILMKGALVKAIERHCKCHFPLTNLLNEDAFICEDSPNLMIYRNALLGTHNFNGTQIIEFIEDWASTGPLIKISRFQNSVRVDSSCPVAISSLDEPVCEQNEKECLYDNDPKYAMCAENLKNNNIANCFEGCVVRNGN